MNYIWYDNRYWYEFLFIPGKVTGLKKIKFYVKVFSSPIGMYRMSFCTTLGIYVMGKALTGKLSCLVTGLVFKFADLNVVV